MTEEPEKKHTKETEIYRTILLRMWGDNKFLNLSPPSPSARYLWIYLLTGPQTNRFGLYRCGKMRLAEELGWDAEAFQEGFRKAFQEVLGEGLIEYDESLHLIFIPNFVKHNLPASPNVVLGWKQDWNMVPECPLKTRAWNTIKSLLDGHGKAFGEAFEKACLKPSIKPLSKTSRKECPNQEQEQDQDQDQEKTKNPRAKNPRTPPPSAFVLPDWIPSDAWNDFEDHRKTIRKPLTDKSRKLAVAELSKLRDLGYPPDDVLAQSILNGWTGLFPLKGFSRPGTNGSHPPRKKTLIEQVLEANGITAEDIQSDKEILDVDETAY